MKKTFKFKAYEVYDLSKRSELGCYYKTIADEERAIKKDDNDFREFRKSMGISRPFKRHQYIIRDVEYTAQLNVEDDDYKPLFDMLCNAMNAWEYGDYCEVYRFKD